MARRRIRFSEDVTPECFLRGNLGLLKEIINDLLSEQRETLAEIEQMTPLSKPASKTAALTDEQKMFIRASNIASIIFDLANSLDGRDKRRALNEIENQLIDFYRRGQRNQMRVLREAINPQDLILAFPQLPNEE